MSFIFSAQLWLLFAIAGIGVATCGFGLVHAVFTPAGVFQSADKRSKGFWLAIMAVGFVLGVLAIPTGLGGRMIFGIISVVAGLIYVSDVRPALRQYRNRRSGGQSGYPGDSGPRGWR